MGQLLGWASLTRVGCAQILGSDDDADAGWVSCLETPRVGTRSGRQATRQ